MLLMNSKLGNLEKGFKQDQAAPLMDRMVFDKVSILFIISYCIKSKLFLMSSHFRSSKHLEEEFVFCYLELHHCQGMWRSFLGWHVVLCYHKDMVRKNS